MSILWVHSLSSADLWYADRRLMRRHFCDEEPDPFREARERFARNNTTAAQERQWQQLRNAKGYPSPFDRWLTKWVSSQSPPFSAPLAIDEVECSVHMEVLEVSTYKSRFHCATLITAGPSNRHHFRRSAYIHPAPDCSRSPGPRHPKQRECEPGDHY